jgi:mono/diheme cytochrome c family protein
VSLSDRCQPQGRYLILLALGLCGWLFVGCQPAGPAQFQLHQVEGLKQEKLNSLESGKLTSGYGLQIEVVLRELFGTPDEPRWPLAEDEDPNDEPYASLLKRLTRTAGPVASDRQGEHVGMYRAHCAHCHGISGDGAGPTAAALNPYPRDFRLGKFKFKSTPLRKPPTDEDLTRVIREGIPGTAMPSFRTLPDDDVVALVDYVKYLSMRGEFERRLWAEVAVMEGEALIDPAGAASSATPEQQAAFRERLAELASDYWFDEVAMRWEEPSEYITVPPPAPANYAAEHTEHQQLVDLGRQVFFGKANCLQCHGETGLGDGQTSNYDDWTNEWIKTPGVDVANRDTYRDFLDAGALPPRPVRPRNLRHPIQRGGSLPADVYRRIANGIEGTPMPSSPALTSDEIWALVAYVKQLPYEDKNRPPQSTSVAGAK